jgi:hypothetical protein
MKWHQCGLMRPIDAQIMPKSPEMASLIAKTTCGCLMPEMALTYTNAA